MRNKQIIWLYMPTFICQEKKHQPDIDVSSHTGDDK